MEILKSAMTCVPVLCSFILILTTAQSGFQCRGAILLVGSKDLGILWNFENLIYTYRIFREQQGYFRIQTVEGVPERIFRTLKDLIYNYEKPNQGLITNLRYPVEKSKASQRSLRFKSGKDGIYDEIGDSDYIAVLP